MPKEESLSDELRPYYKEHESLVVRQGELEKVGKELPHQIKLLLIKLRWNEIFLKENARKFVKALGTYTNLREYYTCYFYSDDDYIEHDGPIEDPEAEEHAADVIINHFDVINNLGLLSVCAFASALAIPRIGAKSKVTLLNTDILRLMKKFVYDEQSFHN